MGMSKCAPHKWEIEALSRQQAPVCPYGIGRFEVTWPHLDLYANEDRWRRTFIMMCIAWGYVPYLVSLFTAVELLIRRGTRELSSLLFLGFIILVNEVFLKNIIHDPRPEESCLHSCGMPSGHSTMASGLLTMCLITTAQRVSQRPGQDTVFRAMSRPSLSQLYVVCRYVWRELKRKCTILPIAACDELSHAEALFYAASWITLLFPILFARVVTNDHSPEQVMVGASIGCFEAMCWCCLVRHLQNRFNHLLGNTWTHRCCGGFSFQLVHNFALPLFVAERRVHECRSKNPDQELRWYEDQTANRLDSVESLQSGTITLSSTEGTEQQYLESRQLHIHKLRRTCEMRSSEQMRASFNSAYSVEEGSVRKLNIELIDTASLSQVSFQPASTARSMPPSFLKTPQPPDLSDRS